MNQREIAKTKMYNALDTFLTDNNAVFSANNAFTTDRANYAAQLVVVNNLATILSVDNTGYSQQKLYAKVVMADKAAALCGFAVVGLKKLKKNLEASQLHISSTEYSHIPDTESKALAQSVHDEMENIINSLDGYVTDTDLSDLQTLIDKFSATQGSATSVNTGTPQQRNNFKQAVINIDAIIADILLLARKYITSNADFYNNLVAQTAVPVVNIHHTTIFANGKKKKKKKPQDHKNT